MVNFLSEHRENKNIVRKTVLEKIMPFLNFKNKRKK